MADCGVALYSNCNCEIDRTSETDLKQNTILSYKSYYIEKLRQQTIAKPFKNVVNEEVNINSYWHLIRRKSFTWAKGRRTGTIRAYQAKVLILKHYFHNIFPGLQLKLDKYIVCSIYSVYSFVILIST